MIIGIVWRNRFAVIHVYNWWWLWLVALLASIPIVALFMQELKIEPILMGFGLDSDDIHSPNESYGLFNYYKGIETIAYFYNHFSQISNKI